MSDRNIMRSNDLRAENRHRVIRILRERKSASRAEIGKLSGLSQAALSTLCNDLKHEGIIENTNTATGGEAKRGRPQTLISLAASAGTAIVVLLTIDRIQVALIDYVGAKKKSEEISLDTRSLTEDQLIETIVSSIDKLLINRTVANMRQISVGFQGIADTYTGELIWSPILKLENISLGEILGSRYSVPVNVSRGCELISNAIHRSENSGLGDSFALLLFSYGVGMGLFLNGKPFRGAGFSGLEVGHMLHKKDGALCRCGKRGCVEAYISRYAIARAAKGKQNSLAEPVGNVEPEIMAALVKAAQAGDKAALEAFASAGSALGEALAIIFNLFDPMPVALMGHGKEAWALMSEEVIASLNESCRTQVDPVSLLHLYEDSGNWLREGVALEALTAIDRQLANRAEIAESA